MEIDLLIEVRNYCRHLVEARNDHSPPDSAIGVILASLLLSELFLE